MADKSTPSSDERPPALIRTPDSETHKAVAEATGTNKTPSSKSSTSAKK